VKLLLLIVSTSAGGWICERRLTYISGSLEDVALGLALRHGWLESCDNRLIEDILELQSNRH
jgi:hypothetical protein